MPADQEIVAFIAGLPKAELHLHLQGAASVPTMLELARRRPEAGVPTDETELAEFYRFTDFAHFIDVYMTVNQLVRSGEDVQLLVVGLGHDLARVNVRYAEVTVTADSHLSVGIPGDELAEALNRGRRQVLTEHGIELGWVYDISGDLGVASGERAVAWAEQYLPEGSVGFGIGGPEAGIARTDFAPVFDRARSLGLHSVPHAGEVTGPESIREAIEHLKAERVDHGIAAASDPALMAKIVDRGIVLEICPTSNMRMRAVPDLREHPFPTLRDAGVRVTLNTDDPGMFGTDLNREYLIAHEVFGLSADELVDLARESVRASFASPERKAAILGEIDAYARTSRR